MNERRRFHELKEGERKRTYGQFHRIWINRTNLDRSRWILHCYTHFKRKRFSFFLHKKLIQSKPHLNCPFDFVKTSFMHMKFNCVYLYRYTGINQLTLKCLVVCIQRRRKNSCVKTFRNFIFKQQQRHTWHVWCAAWNISLQRNQHMRVYRRVVRSFIYTPFVWCIFVLFLCYNQLKMLGIFENHIKICSHWIQFLTENGCVLGGRNSLSSYNGIIFWINLKIGQRKLNK